MNKSTIENFSLGQKLNSDLKMRICRSALLLAIPMLSAVFCQAQKEDIGSIKFTTYSSGSLSLKDSCWWIKRVDTIQTDFVIIVDENNFVKKRKADFIIHKFEQKNCTGLQVFSFSPNKNEVFLLDNKPVEVLLYKPKGQNMLVGNSR